MDNDSADGAVRGSGQPTGREAMAREGVRQPWLWNVVLLDDNEHTDSYVIAMLQELFAMPKEKAALIAEEVDLNKRAICFTTHKELAELKRDQILGKGADPQLKSSKGSMVAIIEPAQG
jgi:ATP-dependent Clp protease adaptor protein ClpS